MSRGRDSPEQEGIAGTNILSIADFLGRDTSSSYEGAPLTGLEGISDEYPSDQVPEELATGDHGSPVVEADTLLESGEGDSTP